MKDKANHYAFFGGYWLLSSPSNEKRFSGVFDFKNKTFFGKELNINFNVINLKFKPKKSIKFKKENVTFEFEYCERMDLYLGEFFISKERGICSMQLVETEGNVLVLNR